MAKMFILMSHDITPSQMHEAKQTLGITEFRVISSKWWGQIPAESESVCVYIKDIIEMLDREADSGDYLLVQGDFGATVLMVYESFKRDMVPIYATTKRVAEEVAEGKR